MLYGDDVTNQKSHKRLNAKDRTRNGEKSAFLYPMRKRHLYELDNFTNFQLRWARVSGRVTLQLKGASRRAQ